MSAGSLLNINSGGSSAVNSAIGSGLFTINGGVVDNTSGSPVTLLTNNAQNWNGDFTFTGTGALNLGTGAVTLGGNRTVTTLANTLTVGGTITGAGRSLTKAGPGNLVLGGANVYTGGTNINAGTLQINNATGLGTGTANIAGSATLSVNVGTGIVSNAITGSGTLNVVPNGETRLRGNLSGFTGSLNIAANGAAKTDLDSSSAISSSATINIASGGTLLVASNSGSANVAASINVTGSGNTENLGALRVEGGGTVSGPVTMSGNVTIGSQTGTGTISGAIGETGGSSSLTKVGGGTLVLGGVNSFSGNTSVAAGVLVLANSLALQNSTLVGGTVNFDQSVASHAFTLGGLTGNSGVVLQDNAGSPNPVALTINNSATNSYNGVLSGSGRLVKAGTGTLVLNGANTFTGTTTLSGGVLSLGNANALNTNALGGSITFAGGTLQYSASNTVDYSTRIKNSTTAPVKLDTNGRNVTFAGAIDLTNTAGLTKIGAGNLVLSGTNTFSGPTTVNAGTLTVNGSLMNSAVQVNGTASLSGTGSIAGLVTVAGSSDPSGQGAINLANNSIGTLTLSGGLTIGGGNHGEISNLSFDLGTTGADVIDLGSGALTAGDGGFVVNLSPLSTGFSHLGTYNLITFGSMSGLLVDSNVTLGTVPGGLYTFQLGFTNNALQLSITGVANPDIAYWTGTYSGTTWGANNNSNKTNWASDSTGATSTQQVPGANTDVVFAADSAGNLNTTLETDYAVNTLTMISGAAIPTSIGGSGKLTLGASASGIGSALAYSAGTGIVMAATAGDWVINTTGGVVIPNNQTWTNNSSKTLTVASNVSGNGALTVAGTGLVILNGTNSYLGGTTISTGANLQVGNVNALGSGALAINGTLDLNAKALAVGALSGTGIVKNGAAGAASLTTTVSTGTTVFSGVIQNGTGPVSLVKAGPGALVLTNASTYTGTTTISTGTLQLGDGTVNGSTGPGGIINNAGLTVRNGLAQILANDISGSGSVVLNGPGSISMTGANTYSGGTTINAGQVSANTLGSGPVALAAAATLTLPTNSSMTWSNAFSGNGQMVLQFGATGTQTTVDNLGGFTGTMELSTTAPTFNKLAVGTATLNPALNLIIDGGTQLHMNGASQAISAIQVSGIGNLDNRGAIRAQSGTLTSAITLLGNTTIGAEGGTIAGSISSGTGGTQILTAGGIGNGDLTLASSIGGGIGTIAFQNATKGTTRLTAANTYSGATTVSAGTLLVNNTTGSGTGSGLVSAVGLGTTLGGFGSIDGNTSLTGGAIVSPGDALVGGGLGTLRFNHDLSLDSGASMLLQIDSTGHDHVSIGGQLNLDASSVISVLLNYLPSSSVTFDLLDWRTVSAPGSLADLLDLPVLTTSLFYWDTSTFATTGDVSLVARAANSPPFVNFAVKEARVKEGIGGKVVNVAVQLDKISPTNSNVSVPVTLALTGAAGAPANFTYSPSTVVIPAGQRSALLSIHVNDDSYPQGTETLTFTLGAPLGAVKGTVTSFALKVDDDDIGSPSVGDVWTLRNPSPTNETLTDVAVSGSVIAAIGSSGALVVSTDNGVTWTRQVTGTSVNLQAITANSSGFVAVGDAGVIVTSVDGATWSLRNAGGGKSLHDVVWTGSQFVAVGVHGFAFTSPDGVDWTFQNTNITSDLEGVTQQAGTLVAVGDAGVILTSIDGVAWTAQTSGVTNHLRSVESKGDLLVAVGDGGRVLTSAAGTTWLIADGLTTSDFHTVHWNSTLGLFAAAGVGGVLRTSADGSSWTARTSGSSDVIEGGVQSGGLSILVGAAGTILTTSNGTTWSKRSSGPTENLLANVWNGSRFLSVGAGGRILTSTDGIGWSSVASPTTNRLSSVAFKSGQVVAVGDAGTVITSATGASAWTMPNTSPIASQNLNSVTYAGSTFAAVGDSGSTYYSTDGVNWNAAVSNTTENLKSVAAKDGTRWVAVGSSGTILSSGSGTSWVNVTRGGVPGLNAVTYASSKFVAVGDSGAVLTSVDGNTWTRRASNISSALQGLTWTGTYFIAVAADGQAYRATSAQVDTGSWAKLYTGNGQPLAAVAASGATLLAAVGTSGTILTAKQDTNLPTINFTITSQTVGENAGSVDLVATISPVLPVGSPSVTVPIKVNPSPATTATSLDYALGVTSVTVAATQTVVHIPITVKSDTAKDGVKILSLSLGTPTNTAALGVGANSTYTLTITDTVAPTVELVPLPQNQMVGIGQPVTLMAKAFGTATTPTGTLPNLQWYKGTLAVTGATGENYSILSATTAIVGKYTVKATNAAGSAVSSGAEVSVVDTADKIMLVTDKSSPILTAVAAGNNLTYQWYKTGANPGDPDVAISSLDTHLVNSTKSALTIKTLTAADEAVQYYCLVSQPSTGLTLASGKFKVRIAQKPVVVSAPTQTLPSPWKVGSPYNGVNGYQIQVDTTDDHKTPTKYTVTGLPPGLTFNATTGVISGKPTTAGSYKVVISASNPAGSSAVLPFFPVQIVDYDANAQGTFVGLFDRTGTVTSITVPADASKALGARFDLATTKTGTFSGKVTVGVTLYSFTGTLDTTGTNPTGTFSVVRKGLSNVTGSFTLDVASQTITSCSISDGGVSDALIKGWRSKWTTAAPTPVVGLHNFIIDPTTMPVADGDKPEGTSYASATVVAAGTATVTGKTADGNVISSSAPVGPTGELLIYTPLYTNTGSLTGVGIIANDATHTVTGSASWSRAAQTAATVRTYKAGWAGAIPLSMQGGRYVPAVAGGIVDNFASGGANNAQLEFLDGGIQHSITIPNWTSFLIKPVSGTTVPIVKATSDPGFVTLTITNSTGLFSGTFTLVEAGGANKRSAVAFQGILIPNTAMPGHPGSGHGYFLLNQLPTGTQTLATSPIESGQVNLLPLP